MMIRILGVSAFHPSVVHRTRNNYCRRNSDCRLGMSGGDTGSWTNLVPDDESAPVRKTILEPSSDSANPQSGDRVEIEYTGRLLLTADDDDDISIRAWSTHNVLECWLKEQQGLYDALAGPFTDHSVDGSLLLDEDAFTEDYVKDTLGVSNKIQQKKTIMAAKRLRTTVQEFKDQQIFDSSEDKNENGTYEFMYGAGKTIKAMEALVGSMQEGERAKVACRADYGYGSEGYRTTKGEVVVPPFCALEFEVRLVSITPKK